MARAAVNAGIVAVAATPHLRSDFPDVRVSEVRPRCDELARSLDAQGIDLRVVPSAEVSLGWALDASNDDLKLASYNQAGIYVLIETPDLGATFLRNSLHALSVRGYTVILAHPERSREFQRRPQELADLAAAGVWLQVNAESFARSSRRTGSGRLARDLARAGLVSVLASDGHGPGGARSITRLAEGARLFERLAGVEAALAATSSRPAAVIDNVPPAEAQASGPGPAARRHTFWARRSDTRF